MLVRTLIDMSGCAESQLRAVSALYRVVAEVIETEKWEVLTAIQTGTWDEGEPHHTVNARLYLGYISLIALPAHKHVCIDICRPDVWAPDRVMDCLQKYFRPGEVKILHIAAESDAVEQDDVDSAKGGS